jgi:hypothetical protein
MSFTVQVFSSTDPVLFLRCFEQHYSMFSHIINVVTCTEFKTKFLEFSVQFMSL